MDSLALLHPPITCKNAHCLLHKHAWRCNAQRAGSGYSMMPLLGRGPSSELWGSRHRHHHHHHTITIISSTTRTITYCTSAVPAVVRTGPVPARYDSHRISSTKSSKMGNKIRRCFGRWRECELSWARRYHYEILYRTVQALERHAGCIDTPSPLMRHAASSRLGCSTYRYCTSYSMRWCSGATGLGIIVPGISTGVGNHYLGHDRLLTQGKA